MTKYCQNCGSALKENARFCEQCGAPVDTSTIQKAAPPMPTNRPPSQPFPPPVQPIYAPQPPMQPAQKKPSACLIGFLIGSGVFLLALALGACGILFFMRQGSTITQDTSPPEAKRLAQTQQAIENGFQQLTPKAPPPAASTPTVSNPVENQPAPLNPTKPAQPAPTQPAVQNPTLQGVPAVIYQNISFSLPKNVATGISSETVPAYSSKETGMPPGVIHPTYFHISLNEYPTTNTMQKPELMVYPAQEYAAMDPAAKTAVNDLTTLLTTKPAQQVGDMPFIPLWPAAQMMHTRVKYQAFQNGSGVRYLTQYGQADYPILNTNLFYTFQGLTDDGKYYINFILPVSNPILSDDAKTVMGPDLMKWDANYPAYKNDIIQKITSQTENSFSPALNDLDAMIQSLSVK